MRNELSICKKCGYNREGEIFDISNPAFFRIIHNKISLKIFFVVFDLLNQFDYGSINELEIIEYNRRLQ